MTPEQIFEIVEFAARVGGPWIALAILWYENRYLRDQLQRLIDDMCEDDTDQA